MDPSGHETLVASFVVVGVIAVLLYYTIERTIKFSISVWNSMPHDYYQGRKIVRWSYERVPKYKQIPSYAARADENLGKTIKDKTTTRTTVAHPQIPIRERIKKRAEKIAQEKGKSIYQSKKGKDKTENPSTLARPGRKRRGLELQNKARTKSGFKDRSNKRNGRKEKHHTPSKAHRKYPQGR